MPAAPTQQSQLPSIAWAANNNALVWKLIGLVEEPSNRKVLIGRGRNEVSDRTQVGKAKTKFSGALLNNYYPTMFSLTHTHTSGSNQNGTSMLSLYFIFILFLP